MKKLILILFVLMVNISISQTTIKQKREFTENGITRGWVITKKMDVNGNIIDYDSSYYEHAATDDPLSNFGSFPDFRSSQPDFGKGFPDMNSSIPKFGESDFGESDFGEIPDFDEFTKTMMDFTKGMMAMTDSLMGMFIGPNRLPQMDGFDQYMDQLDGPQLLQPKKEKLIIPEKQLRKNRKT